MDPPKAIPQMRPSERRAVMRAFHEAVFNRDFEAFKALVQRHPDVIELPGGFSGATLLHFVVRENLVEFAEFLLQRGMNINAAPGGFGPLISGLNRDALEAVSYLLKAGADANDDRSLISAINAQQHSFEFVQLLVQHGVDIHQCFNFGPDVVVNALSWAVGNEKHDIANYLRSLGAVMPDATPRSG